jgi:hypothetical protein
MRSWLSPQAPDIALLPARLGAERTAASGDVEVDISSLQIALG